MTSNEWSLVRRVAVILLVAALFPIGVAGYRLFLNPNSGQDAAPTPPLFTLVPVLSEKGRLSAPTPSPIVLVVPNGWTNYPVEEENFSIAVPSTWQRLPVTGQELDASLAAIRSSNPDLANALGSGAQQLMRTGVKFWAYDPDPASLAGRFATNLTVTRQTLPTEVSFDAYVLVNVSQIEQLSSLKGVVTHERVALADQGAEKIRYNLAFRSADGTNITSAVTLYLLLNRDSAYVLTYATRLEQAEHYAGTFDQSASTFRILVR